MRPYVGVTGFTKKEEVDVARTAFTCNSPRQLMIGVVATYKSLRGIPMKEKWAKQTADFANIKNLFCDDARVLNLVHYSTEEGQEESMKNDLHTIGVNAGLNFHGFQINIPWPNVDDLYEYHEVSTRRCRIILQIGQKAVNRLCNDPKRIIRMLGDYRELIDGILLDLSGGTGKALNTAWARGLLLAIQQKHHHWALGVAGGLGPNTLELIMPLAREFPNLSIDAQGRLRDEENNLDHFAVKEYLSRASIIFAL